MFVSEAHRQLVLDASRLFERLGLSKWMETDVVPYGDLYLRLAPSLHVIVDRIEKLEKDAELSGKMMAALGQRLQRLEDGRADLAAVEESRV